MRILLALLLLGLLGSVAAAQEAVTTEVPNTPPPEAETSAELAPDNWIDYDMRRSWDIGPARTFTSTTIDVGYLYLRPRVSFGYGVPFTKWVGFDVNPLFSSNYIGIYGGVRAEIPHLNFRAGVRTNASYYRTFLDQMDNYDRVSFDAGDNDKAVTITFDTEVEGSYPLGPGNVTGLASVSYVTSVQDGKNVFDESLRVIVDPPWVIRGRAGYLLRWGSKSQHSIGIVGEVFSIPARDESIIVRTGLLVRFVLSRRVEVRGSFIPTIVSPDKLGVAGSDFTELGLRYRWASGP